MLSYIDMTKAYSAAPFSGTVSGNGDTTWVILCCMSDALTCGSSTWKRQHLSCLPALLCSGAGSDQFWPDVFGPS